MEKKPKRTVWARVQEALRDEGYEETQEKAASLAGVKQPSVALWNVPSKKPAMSTACRLAEKLNVCVEWLLTERGPKKISRPDDDFAVKLWELWPRLSDDVKTYILGYATKNRLSGSDPPPSESGASKRGGSQRPFPSTTIPVPEKRRADDSQNPAY